ncbi:MAG TPA: peptide chain release factor N(5)-glutamine methyltransferase [Ilumatobacteraceae bacterium]|nr:peptide chain release factor N(5)-glutamine methyltransferase [Ilumatobacteraceae bacterium]
MTDHTVSWRQLWTETSQHIGRPQARWMCEVASGVDGDDFIDLLDQPATQRGVAHLDSMLARVAGGEPLQYVLGRWGFRHLDLMVDRRVLIPRPETESVVEAALQRARSMELPIVCVDLGTGSGAIGLSLAMELPVEGVTVWMTDHSPAALDVARANAAGIGRPAANVRIAEGSWFEALPNSLRGQLSLIVSNPPYVADDDADLESIVREWEPAEALFAGPDGLDEIRRLISESSEWLAPGGWLILEIGSSHGSAVSGLLRAADFSEIDVSTDLSGRDRVAAACWRPIGQANLAAS